MKCGLQCSRDCLKHSAVIDAAAAIHLDFRSIPVDVGVA